MRYELAERQVVAVSPLRETSQQPGGQVHGGTGGFGGGCRWEALLGRVDLFVVDNKSSY